MLPGGYVFQHASRHWPQYNAKYSVSLRFHFAQNFNRILFTDYAKKFNTTPLLYFKNVSLTIII